MNLGSYDIETYYVVINGVTETRQRILYTDINSINFFVERYTGVVRDGYTGSNTIFKISVTFNLFNRTLFSNFIFKRSFW